MSDETDRLVGLRAAMESLDRILTEYRTAVLQDKEGADAKLRRDVEDLRRTFTGVTEQARASGLRVMESVDVIRGDVVSRYRAAIARVSCSDEPVSRPPVSESLDDLLERFYRLEPQVRAGCGDDVTSSFRGTFCDLVRRLDEYDAGARVTFSAAVRQAEAMVDEGIRAALTENEQENEELVLRAKAQLAEILNTLGEYLRQGFPPQDLERFRSALSAPAVEPEPVTGAVSLDMRGASSASYMGPVLGDYFGDLYASRVLTLPHRMCGLRQTGFIFTYDDSNKDRARKVLNSLCCTVVESSPPGEAEVVVYDPAGSLGVGDAVYRLVSSDGPCRVVRDPTELLQCLTDVLSRIDEGSHLKTCQLFLFDFPSGVDGNLMRFLDTVTDLPFGGVSVNMFYNTSLRISGNPADLERLSVVADRFTDVYSAREGGFTDQNGLFCVCSEPLGEDGCAELMASRRNRTG